MVCNLMLLHSPHSVFLVGDFNDRCLNWDDQHRDSELGTRFKRIIEDNLLFQIIKEPTYIKQDYSSLLDLIITDSPGYIIDSGVRHPLGDPFHCYIYCKVTVQYVRESTYTRHVEI